ncbi:MAG TPA: UDP-N-acetylmuramoyl-L-alanine--D-glutamate ligase, partial [Spirochaeta sp.]|nr:UDP-N-acetylmuramoyl-L-alanine--D-glutamate ligase [Spirochaeta sp.]
MGLGLHGGGSASARFFAESGAIVTVTDLHSREVLQPSIQALSDLSIRYVLEKHEISDFENADIIIKNPAVKPDSPYLKAASDAGAEIETDISTFLRMNRRPVIAVTGSKGKSTTVSALYHVLKKINPDSDLGGNITVSPLTFFSDEKNGSGAPVILELSSWQLADIAGRNLLNPAAAAITNIMHDHQDRYQS